MKIIFTITAFIFASLFSSSVLSEEIKGAFGLKLGDVFEEDLYEIGNTEGGKIIYSFQPTNPHMSFLYFGVLLTPDTKIIYEIWAWNKYDDSAECKSNFEILEILLDKKYSTLKSDIISMDSESAYYKQNERYISLRCPLEFSSSPIYLQYADKELRKLAITEEAVKTNSDGL